MSWELAIAVGAGLVVAAVFYLRTTPDERRLQRARTRRIETSRPWRRGTLIMAAGPPLVLVVGFFTTGVLLVVALGIAFALVGVGLVLMVKAMRAEPKIRGRSLTR